MGTGVGHPRPKQFILFRAIKGAVILIMSYELTLPQAGVIHAPRDASHERLVLGAPEIESRRTISVGEAMEQA